MTEGEPNNKIVNTGKQYEIWGIENLNNLIESGGGDEFTDALEDAHKFGQINEKQLLGLALKLARKTEIDLKEAKEKMGIDPLTGLFNRKTLISRLKNLMSNLKEGSQRKQKAVMVIYMDLNQFKPLNDTKGHEEGDRALVAVANVLRDEESRGGMAFRVGGDEFVFIEALEEDNEKLFSSIASRISQKVNDQLSSEGFPSVSMALGYAVVGGGDKSTADELISKADAAMYRNKRGEDIKKGASNS